MRFFASLRMTVLFKFLEGEEAMTVISNEVRTERSGLNVGKSLS